MVPSVRQKVRMQRWRAREITIQREQYGATVHLFIGTGCNPDNITSMPLTFTLNYNMSYQGLSSLFPLRSVSSFIVLSCQAKAPLAIASAFIHVTSELYLHITHAFIMRELSSQSRSCDTPGVYFTLYREIYPNLECSVKISISRSHLSPFIKLLMNVSPSLELFDLKNSQIWSLLKLLFLGMNANSIIHLDL
jgi:hypothetical protein